MTAPIEADLAPWHEVAESGARLTLTDALTAQPLGEVVGATDKTIATGVKRPSSASFSVVGGGHPLRAQLRRVGAVLLEAFDQDEDGTWRRVHVGPITNYQRQQGDQLVVTIGSTSLIGDLATRLVGRGAETIVP